MRRDTYLNSILTVIAILLTILVWTQLSGYSLVDGAQAQVRSRPNSTVPVPGESENGVSSLGQRAVAQRAEIIEALLALDGSIDEITSYLRSGKLHVAVSGLDEEEPATRRRSREGQ